MSRARCLVLRRLRSCPSALSSVRPRPRCRTAPTLSKSVRRCQAPSALSKMGLWQFPTLARCVDWGYGNRGEAPTGRSSLPVVENGVVAGRFLPQPQSTQRELTLDCHNPDFRNAVEGEYAPAARRDCHNPVFRNVPRGAPARLLAGVATTPISATCREARNDREARAAPCSPYRSAAVTISWGMRRAFSMTERR